MKESLWKTIAAGNQLRNKSQGDRNQTRSHALRNEQQTKVTHNPDYKIETQIDLNQDPGGQHE